MELPEIIRARRTQLGLSQTQLAKAVGVHLRQISRYETGDQQPQLSVAVALADALGISLVELAGQVSAGLDLSGSWWGAWQTWKDEVERIDVHSVTATQQGDYLQLVAERAIAVAEGSYGWTGELRLWDNEVLLGWYRASEAAVRSKGTIYFTLHPHGTHAVGRWVGQSYDGAVITGWGALARAADQAGQLVAELTRTQDGPTKDGR